MADAVVEFLLENLKQLLLYNVDLISGVKEQVESLYRELSLMNAFLRDSKEKRSQYEVGREIVGQIRDIAYEAEDIIDTFVVTAAFQKTRNRISRVVHVLDARSVAKDIELIKIRIREIYDSKKFGIEFLRGFDEEAKTVVKRLTTGTEQLQVISLVGLGGLGKATLAKKIYTDPSIECHFFFRAWVYVSQDYSRKEVFLAILGSLKQLKDKMYKLNDDHLADISRDYLSNGKYLLVHYRRLCIHSHVLDYIRSKPSNPRVRSFLCFASQESELPREHRSFIHKAFKLVRVLDLRSICLYHFPNDIVQLVHLRYVAIYGNFKVLPKSICKLWNLQTLIVETTEREMDIQVDIWKMLQFRHLHTSGSSHLHGPPSKTGKHIEDPFLLNDTFPLSPSQGTLERLPQWHKFPPNLKKITFSDTFLDWKNMSTVGMLPNLEILKLKEYAFMGRNWEPDNGGFRLLRVLQLDRTDLLQWDASSDHFPSLERLVLKYCEKLRAVPSGLGGVAALKMLELYWPSPSAAESALVIQQQQHSMMNNGFKLLVYPPAR
ncbi:hypothetical protein POM88_051146 [Heracleum sosnowskyi]|uniref:Uncharacterized protein n=1 Tax=Heracleum sosnowskyi TaxID=360622 RepID=A0AAD8GYV0_9APIA|nr:hypothetical protein POM88_051146 [Heracleum sosnowskyi]